MARSRAERFDDLVLDAVERLDGSWESELRGVEFAVEEVPPADAAAPSPDPVPLGRLLPRLGGHPARIVVYRRPVEARATEARDLPSLVHDVVVEQVAELLGLDPESVDPDYRGRS